MNRQCMSQVVRREGRAPADPYCPVTDVDLLFLFLSPPPRTSSGLLRAS
jgi:hypothetical protein